MAQSQLARMSEGRQPWHRPNAKVSSGGSKGGDDPRSHKFDEEVRRTVIWWMSGSMSPTRHIVGFVRHFRCLIVFLHVISISRFWPAGLL